MTEKKKAMIDMIIEQIGPTAYLPESGVHKTMISGLEKLSNAELNALYVVLIARREKV